MFHKRPIVLTSGLLALVFVLAGCASQHLEENGFEVQGQVFASYGQ
jgi:hypothetical protein